MKIGILTLPLHINYGGILQAYALQTVLERMGHDVVLIQKEQFKYIPFYKAPFVYLLRIFKVYIGGKKNLKVFKERIYNKNQQKKKPLMINTNRFISQRIHTKSIRFFTELKSDDFEAIVVGSDQIWRSLYINDGLCTQSENAFLDFAKEWNIKRIAYAASFGTDTWEFLEPQTKKIIPLAQSFDAISVRERSGVELCKKNLNVEAVVTLDPTLLLDRNDYISLFEGNSERPKEELMCYILDPSNEKDKIISKIQKKLNISPFKASADKGEIQPPVENWLRAFHESKIVVTDSFHACVFSIIFHKPFFAIVNKQRGQARFYSLLSTFGLESRILNSAEELSEELISSAIDYNHIDIILQQKKEESYNFLIKALDTL